MSFFLHEQLYRDLTPIQGTHITICGTGALGANLAETLARMGMQQLRVIDRDRVEAHNLATQPWTQQDIGAPKTRVLASYLYRAVGARLEAQQIELTPGNALKLLRGTAIVVDAFDNVAARQAVINAAIDLRIPCLHVALGSDSHYGCGLWNEQYALPKQAYGTDGCDYPLTRPLALLVAAAAAEAIVSALLTGQRRGFEVTLRDLQLSSRHHE
jgi:saccharopine dehydrogenase-like NADP-dependent oxidoreductase